MLDCISGIGDGGGGPGLEVSKVPKTGREGRRGGGGGGQGGEDGGGRGDGGAGGGGGLCPEEGRPETSDQSTEETERVTGEGEGEEGGYQGT